MIKWFGSNNREEQPNFRKEFAKENCNFVSYDAIAKIDKNSQIEKINQLDLHRNSIEYQNEPDSVNSPIALTDPNLINSYLSQLESSSDFNFGQTRFVNGFSNSEKRYVLGAEFTITALIACAVIAKLSKDEITATKHETEKENLKKEIEDIAYGSSCNNQNSKEKLKIAKNLEEYSGGFSGSLTDFMFGANISRPTFIIGSGDTLVSIAESLYHDSKLGYLIAQLNRDRTNQTVKGDKLIVEAHARAVLKLPLGNDIDEFHLQDNKKLVSENLITIVKDTSLNKELIEEELKPIVAPSIKWPSSSVVNAKLRTENDRVVFRLFQNNSNKNLAKLKSIIVNGVKVNRSIDR